MLDDATKQYLLDLTPERDTLLRAMEEYAAERDADTEGIRRYTRALYETPGLFTTVIPVRDGISVSLKTG